jgi:hypothetical protein
MRCLESSPLVEDCIFRENVAENTGGGLYTENSSPIVRNTTFLRNTAGVGGGANCLGPSSPRFEDCTFTRNAGRGLAGALHGDLSASVTLTRCTIEKNHGGDGGGVTASACRISLEDCEIRECASDFGGAISCLSGTVETHGCVLALDTASVWGGAVSCIAGSLLVYTTTIEENFAAGEAGAVSLKSSSAALFDSCTVRHNVVGESKDRTVLSGGFYVEESALTVRRSALYGNWTSVYVYSLMGPPGQNADVRDNWWGDDSGPFHPTLNPGGQGDRVSDYVDFAPWEGMTGCEEAPLATVSRGAFLTSAPNPFSSDTRVLVRVDTPGEVRLTIYDACGRLVRSLAALQAGPDVSSLVWDGRSDTGLDLPSGVYFCRLEGPGEPVARKILLLR